MQVAGSLFQSHSTVSTRSCATRSDVRCTQRNGVVVSAKNGDSFAKPSVEEPALLADPEAKFKRYGKDFGKRHIVDTNWLQSSPQVRVRHAVDRAREQLLELAVLNERLTGASPWQIRHRADFLRSSIRNWDMLAQYVTAYDVSMTLDGIEEASRKVDEMLASERQDVMSITNLKDELTQLHGQVEAAQQQLNMTQSRVQQNLQRVEELKSEAATLEALRQVDIEEPKLPVEPASSAVTAIPEPAVAPVPATLPALVPMPAVPEATPVPKSKPEHRGSKFPKRGARGKGRNRGLQSSLRIESGLKNFWFPAMFSSRLQADMMIPFDLCGEAWVLFRDENGQAACIFDQCAHRACPLSLGTVENGQVACPYHGWEFNREGSCTKMPSTMHCNGVGVRALQCKEKYGFVWVWPGEGEPDAEIPDTLCPPPSYAIHAEIVVEVPVEHGLLVENLLDLAHAPFTHTTTFARDWPIPDAVRFKTLQMLGGHWDPYPIDMAFQPPAMTISKIGLAQPGKPASAPRADMCERHLHQVHVCLPSRPGHTRLLYRMALDFWPWIMHVPFIDKVWENVAAQVLGEDLVLVEGQQDRMQRGGDTWNHPVQYDKLAVAYRRWRNRVGDAEVPAESELRKTVTMNAGELFLLEDDELHADK